VDEVVDARHLRHGDGGGGGVEEVVQQVDPRPPHGRREQRLLRQDPARAAAGVHRHLDHLELPGERRRALARGEHHDVELGPGSRHGGKKPPRVDLEAARLPWDEVQRVVADAHQEPL
jgi:hypothetical protein